MDEERKKAYSEVVEVLKLIENEEKIEKIPFEVIQLIKNNSDPTYKPTISKEIPLENQNLRNETYSILNWIATKYWNVSNIEEDNNKNIIENNSKEMKETENSKLNVEAFNDIEPECLEGRNLPMLVSELSWFERIKIRVIQIFKTIFKISTKKEKEGVNE